MSWSGVEFVLPLHVEDLALDFADRYSVASTPAPDVKQAKPIIADMAQFLSGDPANIYGHECFDPLYWIACSCTSLSLTERRRLIDLLCTGLMSLTETITSVLLARNSDIDSLDKLERVHLVRNAILMYCFLISTTVSRLQNDPPSTSKKTKSKSKDDECVGIDAKSKEQVVTAFVELLDHKSLNRLWTSSDPKEEFGTLFFSTGILLMEDTSLARSPTLKTSIFSLVSRSISVFSLQVQASGTLTSLILNSESSAILAASLLQHISADAIQFGQPNYSMTSAVLSEISRLDSRQMARDLKGAKSVATFICELSVRLPNVVLQSCSILLPFLDSEAYTIRSGIVRMLGNIVLDREMDSHIDLNTRNLFMQLLIDRCLDMTSYTRVAVMSTLKLLAEAERIPIRFLLQVLAATSERVLDKSVQVRRVAIQLVTILLQHNAFAGKLDRQHFAEQLSLVEQKLDHLKLSASVETDNGQESGNPQSDDVLLEQLLREQNHYSTGVQFTDLLQQLLPTMISLLSSKNSSDALASIEFLISAREFGLSGTADALICMLPLVFSKQMEVKDAIVSAYDRVYVQNHSSGDMAANLVELASKGSVSELACLGVIIGQLVRTSVLSKGHIQALFSIFGKVTSSASHTRAALDLLAMAGTARPEIVTHNIAVILERGFADDAKTDSLLVRSACVALQRIDMKKSSQLIGEDVFQSLERVLLGNIGLGPNWFSAAEQALNALFMLHDAPHELTKRCLIEVADRVLHGATCTSTDLAEFVFLIGHAAIRMLVYNEQIESTWKQLARLSEKSAETVDNSAADAAEEDLDAIGGGNNAASEELDMESRRESAQQSLLDPSNIIGSFSSLVVNIAGNPSQYPDLVLQMSATLSLCKLMVSSLDFCEAHLQLLFTILQQAVCPGIRANIIISLGDMAFRFPNLIDPWTPNMYAPLKDPEPRVRKNTLMVLSHLILNDMIKVKGEISAVAMCLEDPEGSISDLARLFFSELARKVNNPIYNVLPDTISRLAQIDDVAPASFKRVTKFLIEFIDKERQIERLIDQLCNRFPATHEVSQWRAYAFCLSCLDISNDKLMGKFIGLIKLFGDKLEDDEVYGHIRSIILKGKKTTDVEFRTVLEAFDSRITMLHNCQDPEEQETISASQPTVPIGKPSKAKAKKEVAPRKSARRRTRTVKHVSSSSEDDRVSDISDADSDSDAENIPIRRRT